MTDMPRDNLVRAIFPGVELRAAYGDGMPTLTGHFSVFNQWARIDSVIEGTFMERVAPGAFAKTLQETTPKVLFNHGKDPSIGDKPLGVPSVLEEDSIGARYEVPLLDTSYNRDLIPGLQAGAYGASFRFSVVKEHVERKPARSAVNPDGIPERTIQEARLPEFGPVTFPAYAGATAGVRSLTDDYVFERITSDPERLAQLVAAKTGQALPTGAAATHSDDGSRSDPPDPPPAAATVNPKDPPKGGSSDSRSATVEYITREDKASRVTELKASITARAVEYPGVLPEDVQATDNAENKEHDDLVRDITAWDARQARVTALNGSPEHTEQTYSPPTVIRTTDIYDMSRYGFGYVRSEEDRDQKLRDGAMRSLDTSNFTHSNVDQARAKEGVQHLLDNSDSREKELANRILLTGSPRYRREFAESLRNMRPTAYLNTINERAAALAVTGTTTTGGHMLPYTFDPTFIKTGAWTNINPYRQVCRVEQIVGSNNWQGVSVGAVPAIYETEALAVTEAGPTFARPSVTAQRASSFVSLSYETLQDRPDVVTEIGDLIQEGKDTLEEAQYSVGVGTTVYPLGMFVKSTFTVAETLVNDTFAVGDLDATEAALPIRHRRDAIWMYSRAVIRIIQGWETAYGKLFNSTLGYPAVGNIANNPGGNTGMSLLGYPVWETPSAPVTVTTDDTIVGILVSPKNYIIVDRVGMNVELIPNLIDGNGKVTGQRGILALWRNSAKALNADAGRQVNIN